MRTVLVVDRPDRWPFTIPNIEVVSARSYLTHPRFSGRERWHVYNLCKSYRYQSTGYYVSLLAAARGHKPVPDVATIQELKAPEIVRLRADDLDAIVRPSLAPIASDRFVLSVYFGRNFAARHSRLAAHLFRLFRAPLLRATFARASRDRRWEVRSVAAIASDDIPVAHEEFVVEAARQFFAKRRPAAPRTVRAAYDMAILYDPTEEESPSDDRAIRKFQTAAATLGIAASLVTKESYSEIGEYDALFIRETTNVQHHTYRFARRAMAEGLVVVDDPESIVRCTNKVFLAEALGKHGISTPRTVVGHRDNVDALGDALGFPCILKRPDSAFSQGVVKADDAVELKEKSAMLLERSELIIAQEFVPTPFDWRIGVFDGEPLYACRYFMAGGHWQIIRTTPSGARRSGRVEAVRLHDAPRAVVRTAVRVARLIGDGLYGVDLKQVGRRTLVIEVNDNPSIDAGYEDGATGGVLYERVMGIFRSRLDARHSRVA